MSMNMAISLFVTQCWVKVCMPPPSAHTHKSVSDTHGPMEREITSGLLYAQPIRFRTMFTQSEQMGPDLRYFDFTMVLKGSTFIINGTWNSASGSFLRLATCSTILCHDAG